MVSAGVVSVQDIIRRNVITLPSVPTIILKDMHGILAEETLISLRKPRTHCGLKIIRLSLTPIF